MATEADAHEAAMHWQGLPPAERESFFTAIARHRRAAWRVTAVSLLGISLAALVVAILMAPLFYAVIGLTLDLVNLVIPMPNLLGALFDYLDGLDKLQAPLPLPTWFKIAFCVALPGMLWMALVVAALRRTIRAAASFDHAEAHARPPDPRVLNEQRLMNVVQEMAIAANLPPPQVFVAYGAIIDAAVFGVDERHACLVVTEKMLARLNRDEMQGVVAHLVGSIANGDMTIGTRTALALGFFATMARLSSVLTSEDAVSDVRRVLLPLLLPTRRNARKFAAALADPFAPEATAQTDAEGHAAAVRVASARNGGDTPNTLTWRQWLMVPLYGPVMMAGFFGGMVGSFMLGSLVAFAWRQRKYMADATAVRLTRDPDTLSRALEKLSGRASALANWADHMAIAHSGRSQSVMGGSMVPPFPSLDRRLAALGKLGATLTRTSAGTPLKVWLFVAPLLAIAGSLMLSVLPLMAFVSAALSMLLTGLPVGALHALLRWIRP